MLGARPCLVSTGSMCPAFPAPRPVRATAKSGRARKAGSATASSVTHPRVEPEIAYIMRKPLSGNVSLAEALDAVEAIAPAMEIIDSRYKNFKFA